MRHEIEWDDDQLRRKLTGFFCEFFGMGEMDANTPMPEVRARAELVGAMIGRSLAVIEHQGPIGADIAMAIKAREALMKDALLDSVSRLCTPGGELRERWNKRAGFDT